MHVAAPSDTAPTGAGASLRPADWSSRSHRGSRRHRLDRRCRGSAGQGSPGATVVLNVRVLPGQRPEVMREASRILRLRPKRRSRRSTSGEWPFGAAAVAAGESTLPAATAACLGSHAVLLGAVGVPGADASPPAERPEAGVPGPPPGPRRVHQPASDHLPARDCAPVCPAARPTGSHILVVCEPPGGLGLRCATRFYAGRHQRRQYPPLHARRGGPRGARRLHRGAPPRPARHVRRQGQRARDLPALAGGRVECRLGLSGRPS